MKLIGRTAIGFFLASLTLHSPAHGLRWPFEERSAEAERLHAVLVNGGGRKAINYRSHLEHVRTFVRLLVGKGVPRKNVVIFSADGENPAEDLATRERFDDSNLWLLPEKTRRALRPPIRYVSSSVDGFRLQPATKLSLRRWFFREGTRLRAGDTLLFYVTDHGEKKTDDPTDNTISLWSEDLTVADLRELFGKINRRVRIVMLMSQCFSGGFAYEMYAGDGNVPRGNVCGYFASTPDRPAYGCYPENRGKDGIGHSHEFFQALEPLGRFSEAERQVLVADRTPDVPHTTSAVFVERLLRAKAGGGEEDFERSVDSLLARAWRDRARLEPEIRLLDRVARTFGFFSPRTLRELEKQSERLSDVTQELDTYAERWRAAFDAAASENLERFLASHREWRRRLAPGELAGLDEKRRRAIARELFAVLEPFTRADQATHERLVTLRHKADDGRAASYRNEVRLGALLRVRALLIEIAGRTYLEEAGTRDQRDAHSRLRECEDVVLDADPEIASAADLEPPEPYPPVTEDLEVVQAVMPAWMGIRYRTVRPERRERLATEHGAATVITVYPDSPAKQAGLQVGDLILGPPGKPFQEEHQIREWTMMSPVGVRAPLEVLRGEKRLQLALVPSRYPLELPELPGPPKVGSVAPPLELELYRGTKKLADARAKLLFFWATWCTICKQAVPELLDFAASRRDVDIVAITDEDAETLRPFFRELSSPFPNVVAIDPLRRTFQSYGVSGTPTFVLVDADGVVRHYQTGYKRDVGLAIEGWSSKREAGG